MGYLMNGVDYFLIGGFILFSFLAVYFFVFSEPEFTVTVTIPKQYEKGFDHPVSSNVTKNDIDFRFVPSEILSTHNGYRLQSDCVSFEMYPQSNKVAINSDSYVFNRGWDPNPILLIVDSQEGFEMIDIGAYSSLSKEKIIESDNFQNFTISTSWLTMDLESIHSSYLFTKEIKSMGGNVNVNGFTEMELRLPDEDFEVIFGVSGNSTLDIDKESVKLSNGSDIITKFSSSKDKSIFFKRDMNIQTHFNSLITTRVAEPIILKLDPTIF